MDQNSYLSHYLFIPLSYVRSGFVGISELYHGLRLAGVDGHNWSNRSYLSGAALAYALGFSASAVNSSNNYSRYLAFPVQLSPKM